MNILSLRESKAITNEADFLCEIIDFHAQILRKVRLGRKVYLDGVSFKLFQKDRNTIYRIQFAREKTISNWFLKMSRSRNPEMARREILGAEVVRKALGSQTGYYHRGAIRASVDDAYVLYTEIPGRPLHRVLYLACLTPMPNVMSGQSSVALTVLSETFGHLGRVVAKYHKYKLQDEASSHNHVPEPPAFKGNEYTAYPYNIPPVSRHPAVSLRKAIDKITASDAISRSILQWVERHHELTVNPVFVHGNLRLDNVIVHEGKICLIDFENCGYGPPYNDLCWICCLILLTRAMPLFPWKRARLALNSFLEGYRSVSNYDGEILLQYITMCLCEFYIGTYFSGHITAKIAGIPVSRKRFQQLVIAILEGNINPVLAGVNL